MFTKLAARKFDFTGTSEPRHLGAAHRGREGLSHAARLRSHLRRAAVEAPHAAANHQRAGHKNFSGRVGERRHRAHRRAGGEAGLCEEQIARVAKMKAQEFFLGFGVCGEIYLTLRFELLEGKGC